MSWRKILQVLVKYLKDNILDLVERCLCFSDIFYFGSMHIGETRTNFLILQCCWCIAKEGEKAERTHYRILNKKLKKKLLFNYSPWSINTPEERKLFTVINILKARYSLCRSQ